MVQYMAEAGRVKAWKAGVLKQPPVKPHVGFLLEHPAAQEGKESFFDLPVWKTFSEDQLMAEVLVTMNGRPTILGGNLDLWDLRDGSVEALEAKDPGRLSVANGACGSPCRSLEIVDWPTEQGELACCAYAADHQFGGTGYSLQVQQGGMETAPPTRSLALPS